MADAVVLVDGLPGTDTTTLARAGLTTSGAQRSVELRCEVPVQEARRRYAQRTRAAVHQDGRRLVTDRPTGAARAEPLAPGGVVRVDTSGPVDVDELLRRIQEVPGWGAGSRDADSAVVYPALGTFTG